MKKTINEEKKNSRKRILRIILYIILALIIIFLIHTLRNFFIISNLQKNISNYVNSDNYYIKINTTESNNTTVALKYYKKGDKQLVLWEKNTNGELLKMSMYNNGQRVDTFTETSNSKTVKFNSPSQISVQIYNFLETDNSWQTFLLSALAKVRSTTYNGKACYTVENFLNPNSLFGTEKNVVYIEKDTGLYLKNITDSTVTEREYEFNNVSDSMFVEPDVSQYTIM